MRIVLAIVVSITLVVASCAGARAPRTEPANAPFAAGEISPSDQVYRIDAAYDPAKARLTGSQTLAFTNATDETMSTLHLRLWPNGQSGCSGPFVRVSDVEGGSAQALRVGCTELPIVLDEALAPGDRGEVSFRFTDVIPKNWNFRYGTSGAGVMLGNPFPIAALTDDEGAHHEPYTLLGESMYSIPASWEVSLTIPNGYKAATTGVAEVPVSVAGGRTRTTYTSPDERDFAMAIGRFDLASTSAEGVRLRYFSQPNTRVAPKKVLGWAGEAMRSFTERYGPYDQPQVDLVEGAWKATGNEFPSLLMVAPTRDVVFHEIAHLWWYSMVGDNQYANPWVDEVFAEFSTRRLKGTNGWCDPQRPFEGISGNLPLNASMEEFEERGHYVETIYIGGPCVLERLRRDWGNERFDAFMAALLADYRSKVATTCDVIGEMRAAAPGGYDMEDFLVDARLDGAGC